MVEKNTFRLMGLLILLFCGSQVSYAYDESDLFLMDLDTFASEEGVYFAELDVPIDSTLRTDGYQTLNIPDATFKKPFFTSNDIHMILGLASLGSAALAALTAPEDGGTGRAAVESTHHRSAWWATYLGGAAIVSGFWAHYEDVLEDDGGILDTDNLHAALGILGTVGYYLAVKKASDNWNNTGSTGEDHANAGLLGGVSMIAAIAITW